MNDAGHTVIWVMIYRGYWLILFSCWLSSSRCSVLAGKDKSPLPQALATPLTFFRAINPLSLIVLMLGLVASGVTVCSRAFPGALPALTVAHCSFAQQIHFLEVN